MDWIQKQKLPEGKCFISFYTITDICNLLLMLYLHVHVYPNEFQMILLERNIIQSSHLISLTVCICRSW